MNLKKFASFVFILAFITSSLVGFSPKNVFAAAGAPPVTQFTILGYSWSSLYTGTNNYYDKSYASTVSVPDSTPYIITYEIGYGTRLSPYTMKTIDAFPITDSYNNVVGFIHVTSLSSLPTGLNNIKLSCNSMNSPWNVMSDSISLNIQPQTTTSLKTIPITSLKNIKTINDVNNLIK